ARYGKSPYLYPLGY
uniref:Hypothalamic tetradecapeptide n=1 Tax=Sus scrofa TaxID=9823 RepID=HY14_PIG|nr:RecName: Full=Hypothalamic tetradecapeptide [Sus scrofa]